MLKKVLFGAVIAALLIVPTVSALSIPSTPGLAQSGSIFGNTAYDSFVFSLLFGAAIFAIFYQALQRTTLGPTAGPIALLFGAIIAVLLYTNAALLQLFLKLSVTLVIFVVLLAAVIIPGKQLRGRTATKLVGVLTLLVFMYIIFENPEWANFTASASRTVGFNVGAILAIAIVAVVLSLIVLTLFRMFRRARHPLVRVLIPMVIIYLLLAVFVPGFGSFLLGSLYSVLAIILMAVVGYILYRVYGRNPAYKPGVQPPGAVNRGKSGGPKEERGFKMIGYVPPSPPEKKGFFGQKKALPPPNTPVLPSPKDMEKMHPGLLKRYGYDKRGYHLGKRKFITLSRDVVNPETGEHKTIFPKVKKKK